MNSSLKKDLKDKTTLHFFLEENSTLLSSVGVMTGLGGVLGSIPTTLSKPFTLWPLLIISIFSLSMMLGALLVWYEIMSKFPSKPDLRLRLFKYVLQLGYWLVVLFLFLLYRNLSSLLLPVWVFFMIGIPLVHSLIRFTLVRNFVIELKNKPFGNVKLLVIIAVFATIMTKLVMYVSEYFNIILNYISSIRVI